MELAVGTLVCVSADAWKPLSDETPKVRGFYSCRMVYDREAGRETHASNHLQGKVVRLLRGKVVVCMAVDGENYCLDRWHISLQHPAGT